MLASRCYLGSGGRMDCTSCHDPHGMPAPEARVEFYRAKCLACHADRGCAQRADARRARQPDDSCAACHMPPALELASVLHVAFADHRVLREPNLKSAHEKFSPPQLVDLVVFDHADERLPQAEIDRALGFLLTGGTAHMAPAPADARRAEELLLSVLQQRPDDVPALESLGAACLIQGRSAEAEAWFLKVLDLDPRCETALLQLAILYHDSRQIPRAREFLERYLAVNPWHGSLLGRYASTLGLLGRWRECIAAGEHGLELNPTLAPLHELLAYAYDQVGQTAQAERHRFLFARLQSRLPPRRAAPSP